MSNNTETAAAVRNEAVASCRAAGIALADIGRVLILPQPVNVTVGGLDDGVTFLGCLVCGEDVAAAMDPADSGIAYEVALCCFLCSTEMVAWDQFSGRRAS